MGFGSRETTSIVSFSTLRCVYVSIITIACRCRTAAAATQQQHWQELHFGIQRIAHSSVLLLCLEKSDASAQERAAKQARGTTAMFPLNNARFQRCEHAAVSQGNACKLWPCKPYSTFKMVVVPAVSQAALICLLVRVESGVCMLYVRICAVC